MNQTQACQLCGLLKRTHWYYECDDYVICDCLTCGVPMLVWREHTMRVNYVALNEGLARLAKYAIQKWGRSLLIFFRFNQRQIPDHFHVHAEKDE